MQLTTIVSTIYPWSRLSTVSLSFHSGCFCVAVQGNARASSDNTFHLRIFLVTFCREIKL